MPADRPHVAVIMVARSPSSLLIDIDLHREIFKHLLVLASRSANAWPMQTTDQISCDGEEGTAGKHVALAPGASQQLHESPAAQRPSEMETHRANQQIIDAFEGLHFGINRVGRVRLIQDPAIFELRLLPKTRVRSMAWRRPHSVDSRSARGQRSLKAGEAHCGQHIQPGSWCRRV